MILVEIRSLHRQRCYLIKQRIRSSNALGAFVRLQFGWNPDLSKTESDAIKAKTKALIKAGGKGTEFENIIAATTAAARPFDELEDQTVKRMEKLAKTLPVWKAWGEGVVGFGPAGLATIIGEAGDLSNYPSKAHLWKRMGLGIVGDIRQGGLSKGAPDSLWIEHGYNRERRSRHYAYIGEPLLKKPNGEYYGVYQKRKLYEQEKAKAAGLTILPAADIPAKNKDEYVSEKIIHLRAFRYMEQRFLKHLWQAWNRNQ